MVVDMILERKKIVAVDMVRRGKGSGGGYGFGKEKDSGGGYGFGEVNG